MALISPHITSTAVMLDAIPTLTGVLALKTVPVIFIEGRRVDGPINEWVLGQWVQNVGRGG